jgi:hypothetical protein
MCSKVSPARVHVNVRGHTMDTRAITTSRIRGRGLLDDRKFADDQFVDLEPFEPGRANAEPADCDRTDGERANCARANDNGADGHDGNRCSSKRDAPSHAGPDSSARSARPVPRA